MTRSEWREVALGQICEFKYGKSLPASGRDPGVVGVYGSNGLVGSHSSAVTNGPTIIIGRKGSFGEITYSEESCWPIDTTYYVDSSSTNANLRWLYYRLGRLGLKELNRAAAVPGLNREDAYRKRLLLPPAGEQQRIAEVLDEAGALLAKRGRMTPLFDELAQSVFLDMFGDIRNDDMVALGDYLTFVTSGGRGWAKYYSDSGSRFIRSLDVRMNEIEDGSAVYVTPPNNAEARRTRVHSGDVLLTITGSLIGRVAPVSPGLEGSYVSQHVAILRPEASRLDSGFLAFFLSIPSEGQRQIARLQYGQTKPGLNFEQIRKMRIPLPGISQQRLFAERLIAVRRVAESNRAHLEGLEQLADSIQHRAFRGEL